MRHHFFRTIISQREQRTAALASFRIERFHHRGGAFGDSGKTVNTDIHCHQKVFETNVEIFSAQGILVGEANRVDNKVNRRPACGQRVKGTVKLSHVRHITIDQKVTPQLLGQRTHPLFHDGTLVTECQFGTFRLQPLRNAPGERLVIRQPHNQPAFASHQSSHIIPFVSGYPPARYHHVRLRGFLPPPAQRSVQHRPPPLDQRGRKRKAQPSRRLGCRKLRRK